ARIRITSPSSAASAACGRPSSPRKSQSSRAASSGQTTRVAAASGPAADKPAARASPRMLRMRGLLPVAGSVAAAKPQDANEGAPERDGHHRAARNDEPMERPEGRGRQGLVEAAEPAARHAAREDRKIIGPDHHGVHRQGRGAGDDRQHDRPHIEEADGADEMEDGGPEQPHSLAAGDAFPEAQPEAGGGEYAAADDDLGEVPRLRPGAGLPPQEPDDEGRKHEYGEGIERLEPGDGDEQAEDFAIH